MNCMKKIISALLFIPLFISCGEMYDNIKEYLDEGETQYLPKVKSLEVLSGKERIRFRWKPGEDTRVEACKIYWNNKQDSIVYPVNRSEIGADGLLTATIPFPEGVYSFQIYQTGNNYRSIGVEVTGISFGEFYQSTLPLRKINSVNVGSKTETVINWSYTAENEIKTELSYETVSGTVKTIVINPGVNSTTLTDYKARSGFLPLSVKTSFLPVPQAIDTFSVTGAEEINVVYYYSLSRTDWTAEASSNHIAGEYVGPGGCIDGNTSTFWHSNTGQVYPHWVVIDMKANKMVKQIEAVQHPFYIYIRTMKILLSADGENWTEAGIMTQSGNPTTNLVLNDHLEARYIRIEMIEGNNVYANLCEVYVYGFEPDN